MNFHSIVLICPTITSSHRIRCFLPSDLKSAEIAVAPLQGKKTPLSSEFLCTTWQKSVGEGRHTKNCVRQWAGTESPFSNMVSQFLTYQRVSRDSRTQKF